jgi:hypothetical protein
MNASENNAFLRGGNSRRWNRNRSLAGLLSPMRARLDQSASGFSLTVEPMRAVDALDPFLDLVPTDYGLTLLCGEVARSDESATTDRSIGALARRHGITVVERFSDRYVLVDEQALRALAARTRLDGLTAVLIDGPVEQCDVDAIDAALARRGSPLEAELRAVAAMRVVDDRVVTLETRESRDASRLAAENFRHYLAALRGRPSRQFAAPEAAIIERLLEYSGEIAVRPIETEVFSTSVDVGVSTQPDGDTHPADQSLIYDVYSNSWHGE